MKPVNFTMQVRDRHRLTVQALTSLAAASLDQEMSVTVLDDRSNPTTASWVRQWCNLYGAHYVRNEEPLGTGQLRNMVMEESRKFWGQGEYVAPHDNDVFFRPRWMEKLIECYEESWQYGFRLMGAYGHPYHHPIEGEQWVKVGTLKVKPVQALATQSMFMAWNVWDQYGPFCDTPTDKTCQSEDVDFTNKLRKDGFRLGVVTPHLINATALKNTFGEPGPGWEYVKAECPEGVICE